MIGGANSDISAPPNIPQHPPTCGTTSPQSELHPATGRYVNALSCVLVLQSTIFYFNVFSVQLHLAINDRVQSASA